MSTKKKDTTPVQMTQRDGVTMILEKKTKKASPEDHEGGGGRSRL